MKERVIEVAGARIRYLEHGDGPERVVFCHGNSSSSEAFTAVMEALGSRYRSLSLDLYGHGDSELPDATACAPPRYAKLIDDFIRATDSAGCLVVGHSLGGHASLEALPALAGRVRGVLAIAAPPFSRETIGSAFLGPVGGLIFQDVLTKTEAAAVADALVRRENVTEDSYDLVVRRILRTKRGARSGIGSAVFSGEFADELAACRETTVPTAFVQGCDDVFINLEYYASLPRLLEAAPRVTWLERTGHSPHLERPAAVADVIHGFSTT